MKKYVGRELATDKNGNPLTKVKIGGITIEFPPELGVKIYADVYEDIEEPTFFEKMKQIFK